MTNPQKLYENTISLYHWQVKKSGLLFGIIIIVFLSALGILVGPKILHKISQDDEVLSSNAEVPSPSSTSVFDIVVANDKVSAGSSNWIVTQGNTVFVNIVSDKDSTFVISGYQKSIELKKNQNVVIQFVADTVGEFPYQLKDSSSNLGILTVNPK